MRRLILLVSPVLFVVLLAACGGNTVETPSDPATDPTNPSPDVNPGEDQDFDNAPFGTPLPPDDAPSNNDSPQIELTLAAMGAPISPTLAETPARFGGVQIPPEAVGAPGEVIYSDAQETEEPDPANGAVNFETVIFDEVSVQRAGGPGRTETAIQIFQDGTVLVDGAQVAVLTPQQVIDLDNLLDEIRIFQISGQFAAVFTQPQDYVYMISVEAAGNSTSLRADDTLMPQQLRRVVQYVLGAAFGLDFGAGN